MSGALLIIVSIIACNMKKVVKEEPKTEIKEETTAVHNGKVVVIDPGHGGDDPGKVGVSGILEKDINLQIALKLKNILEKEGYKAVLTRETDMHLSENEKIRKTADLNRRLEIINVEYENNNNTIMISIHQNSFTNESVHGAQCFYYADSEKSKKLAEDIQQILNEKVNTHKEKKTKSNNDYYMLINSKCPGIIIECGFLSNYEEEVKLMSEVYQEELAEMIKEGIEKYYGDN